LLEELPVNNLTSRLINKIKQALMNTPPEKKEHKTCDSTALNTSREKMEDKTCDSPALNIPLEKMEEKTFDWSALDTLLD
jgi:hypothetical protein